MSRVVLEPTITRRADAATIGDRLSRFARERLPALIDEALEGYAQDARERIVERLEIDLGSVEDERLEARLEERVVGLLRTALIDRFGFPASVVGAKRSAAEKSADGRGATSTASGFSDLAALAEPGDDSLPSHAGAWSDAWGDARLARLAAWFEGRVTAGADTIEETFLDALNADTPSLVRLMREHGRHTARRERWVGAMTAAMRVRAVQALRPNDARAVLGDVDYVAARQRAAPVARMRPDDFDDALWQTVFAYLLADRGGRFNRRSFLAALLRGLATRAGLEYFSLIDALLERLGSAADEVERDESLRRILLDLREDADRRAQPAGAGMHASHEQGEERVAGGVDDVEGDRMPTEGDARDAQTLAFYLDFGALPWFADKDFDPVEVALRIARRSPSRMVALLRGDDAWSLDGNEGGHGRGGRTHHRRVDIQRRQERLAASLDVKARAKWIAEIEPTAARSVVGTLAALDALIERMPWPRSRRATLRRAISAATLETLVAMRAGAFSETMWFERMLARAAAAVQLLPAALVDALILATHSAPGTARRILRLRAGLLQVTANAGREAASDAVGASVHALAAAKPAPAAIEGHREASTHAGPGDLAAAFVAAWPALLHVLRLVPTQFDAVELRALSNRAALNATESPTPAATSGNASIGPADAVLATLTRLARYHGIPLRRWLAALVRNEAWKKADRGRAQLRRWWRDLPREAVRIDPAELTAMGAPTERDEAPGAAQAFVEFFSSGYVRAEAAHWLSIPSRQWLELALQGHGAWIMERLRARSADPAVLRRLSAFLKPDAVLLLTATLERADSRESKELLDAASAMASRLGRPGIAREARRALLAALLSPSGAQMSLNTRIARVVEGLARRIGIEAGAVAEHLHAFVLPKSTALREVLAALTAQCVTLGSTSDERVHQSGRLGANDVIREATDATSTHAVAVTEPATTTAAARPAIRTKPTSPHDEMSPSGRSTEAPHRAGPELPLIAAYLRYGESESPASLHAAFHRLAHAAPRLLARLLGRAAATEPGFSRLASLRGETFVLVARVWSLPLAPVAVALSDAAMAFAPSAREQMRFRAQAIWLRHAPGGGRKAMLAALVEATFADTANRAIEASRGDVIANEVHRTAASPPPTRGASTHAASRSQNRPALAQPTTERHVLARWRRAVTATTRDDSLARDWMAWLSARESILGAGAAAGAASETPGRREPARAPRAPDDTKPEPPDMPSAPIQVENAGIVMLWPFLSRFFEMLELQRGGRFVDFDAQSRAVHLLHALATNAIAHHEALLPLAKILCGIAPALPLAAGADRERDERELALSEGLLNGVKQNWEKLRGTTIDGLRESFLMRSGRLEREDGAEPNWRLSVEVKAFDVLLDTLPWNLSMVRLAWMPELLTVNWRNRRP